MGAEEAGAFLRGCLESHPWYRERWLARLEHPRRDSVLSEPAVCRVLAEHLWDTGEEPESRMDLPRRLRDRVRRALQGTVFTQRTLAQLAAAFDLTPQDLARVTALLHERPSVLAVAGTRLMPAAALPVRRHRTVSLHEHHYVGPDRSPVRHRTVHVVQSTADILTHYPYIFDTFALTVEVVHGGRVADQLTGLPDGLFGVSIELTRPLARGETTSLKYGNTFCYPVPPAPEFRRAASTRTDNVDVRVEFDPSRLPRSVSWCVWHDLDAPPVSHNPVPLGADRAVHRWVPFVEQACVGFRWEW